MKWIIWIGLVLIALYMAGLLLIYTQQRKMMYFPPANYLNPVGVALEDAEEVPIMTSSGIEVTAWWIPPEEGKSVIMFFHGNGSAVFSNYDIYQDLSDLGYGVLGVGYPGYPGSGGTPSERGLVAAAQAQYDFLIERGIAPERVVFYGTSLGAGVAAQLSKTRKPSLMIMEAPFTSALEMARGFAKIFPTALLMKDKYLSDAAIQGSGIPLLWLHGTNDIVISYTMGQALYDGYDGPKTARVIDGGQHNNLWFVGGREIVLDALAER